MFVCTVWLKNYKNLFSMVAWDTGTVCDIELTEHVLMYVFGFAF